MRAAVSSDTENGGSDTTTSGKDGGGSNTVGDCAAEDLVWRERFLALPVVPDGDKESAVFTGG